MADGSTLSWCFIKFKPKTCRSLSKRKDKIEEAVVVTLAEQQILILLENQWNDSSMKDINRGPETVELASRGLRAIIKCRPQGKCQVFGLQFKLTHKQLKHSSLMTYAALQ
ncbi:reverse transcriptase [Elysia marginata]|uniref:Reverse transcriptase n=1 Tax=Elysia marginata TaxID=1093978 RepID=A0AAV4HYU3_9GAST|nr:reverse transcriptase [Elysia marginata]